MVDDADEEIHISRMFIPPTVLASFHTGLLASFNLVDRLSHWGMGMNQPVKQTPLTKETQDEEGKRK